MGNVNIKDDEYDYEISPTTSEHELPELVEPRLSSTKSELAIPAKSIHARRTSLFKIRPKPAYSRTKLLSKNIQLWNSNEKKMSGGSDQNMKNKYFSTDENWRNMIGNFQNNFKPIDVNDMKPLREHHVKVCVRKRPQIEMENDIDITFIPYNDAIVIHELKTKLDLTRTLKHHKFRFDYVFDDKCSNKLVYENTAKPLVSAIFEGTMATCFAYGQTGTGKTYTMFGDSEKSENGIYLMAAKDIFKLRDKPEYKNLIITASLFEIYNRKIFDLLSDKKEVFLLENGKQEFKMKGLTENIMNNVEDIMTIIDNGIKSRSCGQNSINKNSSRSHAVLEISLKKSNSENIHGKFSFIDLAGNERGSDALLHDPQSRNEGVEINQTLLTLKEFIRALNKPTKYLPARASKLTQVLRDSFVHPKSKTCMIAMISPSLTSYESTINTLRYANRVKELNADNVCVHHEVDNDKGNNIDINGNTSNVTSKPRNDKQLKIKMRNESMTLQKHDKAATKLFQQTSKMYEFCSKKNLNTTSLCRFGKKYYETIIKSAQEAYNALDSLEKTF